VKFAGRFQGRFARQIFDKLAPESVHQARRDAAQDEKLLLAKASLGGRISALAENVARIAEIQATQARRGATAAGERSEQRFRSRANRTADRAEAQSLRTAAGDLDLVRSSATELTRALV
jgi:hypothetical protein